MNSKYIWSPGPLEVGELICLQDECDKNRVHKLYYKSECGRFRFKWSDSSYNYAATAAQRCIAEGLAEGFERVGNSGIPSRNWVILHIPTVAIKALVAKKISFLYGDPTLGDVKEWSDGEEKEVEIPDPAIVEKCLQILMEEKDKEGQKELLSLFKNEGVDVVEVREFNKILACRSTQPQGVFSILKKSTSYGNSTILLVRVVNGKIRCPDEYKGLIIGKRGKNVNEISQKMGCRIQVE